MNLLARWHTIIAVILPVNFCFAQDYADCAVAYRICDKNRVHFVYPVGEGANTQEDITSCFSNGETYGNPEKNSVWIRFDILEAGSVTFGIIPDSFADDLDFVVYKLPDNGDCVWKSPVRCMAAGDKPENINNSPCLGPTGLRNGESDTYEDAGCADKGDNNWLSPLETKSGEKYMLLVSNITAPYRGFSIRFGGNATFSCDQNIKK